MELHKLYQAMCNALQLDEDPFALDMAVGAMTVLIEASKVR